MKKYERRDISVALPKADYLLVDNYEALAFSKNNGLKNSLIWSGFNVDTYFK